MPQYLNIVLPFFCFPKVLCGRVVMVTYTNSILDTPFPKPASLCLTPILPENMSARLKRLRC